MDRSSISWAFGSSSVVILAWLLKSTFLLLLFLLLNLKLRKLLTGAWWKLNGESTGTERDSTGPERDSVATACVAMDPERSARRALKGGMEDSVAEEVREVGW